MRQAAVGSTRPGDFTTYLVTWSLGSPYGDEAWVSWVEGVQRLVETGVVRWSPLAGQYEVLTRWEAGR